MKPPYADPVGPLYSHGFKRSSAGIVGGDDAGTDRIGCQGNVIRGLDGIIINRGAIADGIDSRNAGMPHS